MIFEKLFEKIEIMQKMELSIKFDEEMEKIKKWNEKTFPDATMAVQLLKLEEELREFTETKTQKEQTKELADVFIVLGGLKRWDCLIGNFIRNRLLDDTPVCVLKMILKAIRRKMDVNRKRTWKKSSDGRFQHSNKE